MSDMANNKVQLGDGTVLIDLTGDTVTPSTLKRGITAHDASGQPITGIIDEGSDDWVFDVTGELDLATMQVSNIVGAFSAALTAIQNHKAIRLSLHYTNPSGTSEWSVAYYSRYQSSAIWFSPLMAADFGNGAKPYLFDVLWTSSGMAIEVYALSTGGYKTVVSNSAPTSADANTITIVM